MCAPLGVTHKGGKASATNVLMAHTSLVQARDSATDVALAQPAVLTGLNVQQQPVQLASTTCVVALSAVHVHLGGTRKNLVRSPVSCAHMVHCLMHHTLSV